ncbi:hypothetical protein ELI02_28015 (plasmid) [Rhizobium leguminosarum]|uniref:hypothetical protein n=1 Tax=Rhizobium leguminosarum TaxID=384 RepID=UPI0010309051|nr:hypothetical protein [Rhizobium leguminosarum]TAX22774.1 hypothetical protein ELI04_32770 [Rhizobium leguminosarum]TAX45608.1 hypothetical protein ELI02_28015 [Rhizobium leguminosarum]
MADNVVSVFTFKSIDTILDVGGTQSWTLDRARVKACKYAVVCRNAHHSDVEGPEAHGSAFMVGKVSDIVPSTETQGRWLILFSEYALCNVGDQWEGRNPVRFWTTDDFDLIDFDALNWEPMPEFSAGEAATLKGPGLTIAEAKAGLSLTFGVDPAAIEIIIRA